MKVFIWEDIERASDYYHRDGSVVVFAEDEQIAREMANVNGCEIQETELPVEVREVDGGAAKAYWFPNAGCC